MMGPLSENRVASFSFFTHIDLFLLFGIFLFKHEKPNELCGKGIVYLISFLATICFFFILTIYDFLLPPLMPSAEDSVDIDERTFSGAVFKRTISSIRGAVKG